jgi:tetratricopeptide (TPR) repeat protein
MNFLPRKCQSTLPQNIIHVIRKDYKKFGRIISVHSVGRNDPCHCGSGLKYKKCCLKAESRPGGELSKQEQTLADAYKKMGDEEWREAITLFTSLLDSPVEQTSLHESIAACFDGMEEYLKAAEHYEKALATADYSKRFDLTYRLGVSRGCAGRTAGSIDAFRNCQEIDAEAAKAWAIDKVIDTLESINRDELSPDYFLVQVQLQRVFTDMESENYTSALERLDRIRKVDPDNAVILYNMGVALTFLRREDEAYSVLERTVALAPDSAPAWYNMGQICLIKKKDYSKALNCFTKAVTARPDYIGAHFQSGVSWELLGDNKRAAACFEKVLEIDPENKPAREKLQQIRESHTNT